MSRLLVLLVPTLILCSSPAWRAEAHDASAPGEAPEENAPTAEKPWLANLEVAVRATGVLQAAPKEDTDTERNATDAPWSFAIEMSTAVSTAETAHISFETGRGAGVDGRLSSISGFNGNAVEEQPFRLYELWLEQRWMRDRARLRAGITDLTYLFDLNAVANCQWEQFMSPGFVNNLGVELPGDTGPAAALWVSPSSHLDLGVGLAEADADLGNVFRHAFQIAEADVKVELGGQPGTYRLYGWRNGLDHASFKDESSVQETGHGVGLSCDQAIGSRVALFGRWAHRNGSVYQTNGNWSAGLQFAGHIVHAIPATCGLAYGVAWIGPDWVQVSKMDGIEAGPERHVEAYTRFELNDHVSLTPDVQWVKDRDGDVSRESIWVMGLRARLSF